MKLVLDLAVMITEAGFWGLLIWSWQAAVLIAAVWLGLKLFRVQSPALRHQVWFFCLIAVAVSPIWSSMVEVLPLPRPTSEALIKVADVPQTIAGLGSSRSVHISSPLPGLRARPSDVGESAFSLTVGRLLFTVWFAGALVVIFRIMRNTRLLHRIRLEARPITPEDLDCGDLRKDGEIERVGISSHDLIISPLLAGLWRPSILLPTDLSRWTTAAERRAMLQHEIAHLARRDHYVNLFLKILKIVFYFHPLVIFACRQLEIEREMACDDYVIEQGTEAEIYVESILKAAGRKVIFQELYQLGVISSKQILERRIGMILNKDRVRYVINHRRKLALSVALISVVIWMMTPAHSEPAADNGRTSGYSQASFDAMLTAEQGEQLKQASTFLTRPYSDTIAITPEGQFPIKVDSSAYGFVKNAFLFSSRLVIKTREFESPVTITLTEEQRQRFYQVLKRSIAELHIEPTENDDDMTAALSKSPHLRLIDNLKNTISPDSYLFRFNNKREEGVEMMVMAEYRNVHKWMWEYFPQLLPVPVEPQIRNLPQNEGESLFGEPKR